MAGVEHRCPTKRRRVRTQVTDPDPLYVAARRTLIDVVEALYPHAQAVTVVGAHAVYLRTGDAGIPIAPFTTDADLALDPARLEKRPGLEQLLQGAGFERIPDKPGAWTTSNAGSDPAIPVDLMVPDAVAPGSGRRSVSLPGHDKSATRRAVGLEPSLVDSDLLTIRSLDPVDERIVTVRVAGSTALLVAKLHKIHDRVVAGKGDRLGDKDAADAFRLMQTTEVASFVEMTRTLLSIELSRSVTEAALRYMRELFGASARPGVRMALRALTPAVPSDRIEAVISAFVGESLAHSA